MPIINAAHTVYDSVYLPLPTGIDSTNLIWQWGTPYRFLVSNISTKQVATLDFDTMNHKGDPRGTIWNVGDTVWQVDFTIPFLIPLPDTTTEVDEEGNGTTVETFPAAFTEPYCANLPVVSNVAAPIFWFLYAAIFPLLGPRTSTISGLWNTHWAKTDPARELDIVVQRLSVQVNEGGSTLTVSLLCTQDPRSKFMIKQNATTSIPMRMAMPWDFWIPVGEAYLGSMIDYEGGYDGTIPERRPYAAGKNHGLVREWGFTIQSQVTRFKSVGTPSGRPLLGVTAITCEGNLKYVPITQVVTGTGIAGESVIDDAVVTDRLPVGWMVDTQALETVERAGGQLYITGQPPYTGSRVPIYVAMNMIKGDSLKSTYSILGSDILGPIGVASASFDAQAGGQNSISIDFKTLVGVTALELSSVLTGS